MIRMKILLVLVLAFACLFHSTFASECRFAKNYKIEEILNNAAIREQFKWDIASWEGNFAKNGIGLNMATGFTYDGHGINYATGLPENGTLHYWSAPSKESIHLILLAQSIAGDKYARKFVCNECAGPEWMDDAFKKTITILTNKINSYEKFNNTFPGFGGFLPWVYLNDSGIIPANGWSNQVPGLDNGEWVWGLKASIVALKTMNQTQLASRYQSLFDYLAKNVLMIFYAGHGLINAVTYINNTKVPPFVGNYHTVPGNPGYLDDPYEGETMAVFMDLYAHWGKNISQRNLIWKVKEPKLQRVEFVSNDGNITVQRGWYFSSHEQWKYLELPYRDVPINWRVFLNGERARTRNSVMNKYRGLFASVNQVSPYGVYNLPPYLSAAGIPSIAFQEAIMFTTVTPYASFPTILADPGVGLAWYHLMISGPAMQGPLGSTEACNTSGTAISPVTTWDSKITTLAAIVGGCVDLVRDGLKFDNKYDRFIEVINKEWTYKFGDKPLYGDQLPYVPPLDLAIPHVLSDFNDCN